MDVLSGFQLRGSAPLDDISQMLGLPGKLGMHGGEVWDTFLEGGIERIRSYCETDVLNTYLVYLRFELMRGRLDSGLFKDECARVRKSIEHAGKPHLNEFLAAWPDAFDKLQHI
jgi:predicted PolB exonuclease-like 3'-5' exonuclease